MGIFNKKPSAPPPIREPYLRGLRDFGEFLADGHTAYDPGLLADLDMMNFARDQPATFIERLASAIFTGPAHISDYAGPCCLGATEWATTMGGSDLTSPAWNRIVDVANSYLRESKIPYASIKPFMRERWERAHAPNEW